MNLCNLLKISFGREKNCVIPDLLKITSSGTLLNLPRSEATAWPTISQSILSSTRPSWELQHRAAGWAVAPASWPCPFPWHSLPFLLLPEQTFCRGREGSVLSRLGFAGRRARSLVSLLLSFRMPAPFRQQSSRPPMFTSWAEQSDVSPGSLKRSWG